MGRQGEAQARRGRRDAREAGRGRAEYKERGAGVRAKEEADKAREEGRDTLSGVAEGWLGRRNKGEIQKQIWRLRERNKGSEGRERHCREGQAWV